MHVLGINADQADVSAVLLRDGEVLIALEEERFRRVKHCTGFPSAAIRQCLRFGGIDATEIDSVAVNGLPRANLHRKALFALRHPPGPSRVRVGLAKLRSGDALRAQLGAALGLPPDQMPPIRRVEHHLSHLASAYFASSFDDAAVCSMDGFGDFASTSMARGRGGKLELLGKTYFPHSLGVLYTAVTHYLGFTDHGDEYKVMGLAAYGRPTLVEEVSQLVTLLGGGKFRLDRSFFRRSGSSPDRQSGTEIPSFATYPLFSQKLEQLLGPARLPGEALTRRHQDIARSLQTVFERAALHLLHALWARTKSPRLCLAGGCFLNSVLNGKIREATPFQEVFIQPAAGDNGTALGAAFAVWHHRLANPRTAAMQHAYLGTRYTDAEVKRSLAALRATDGRFQVSSFINSDSICRTTAQLIAGGAVVGWFRGRMEWGSRALGARSILADPRRAETRGRLNEAIKARESFRPFAPSILEPALPDYFVGATPDPFMLQVHPISRAKRSVVPAVTHVDGTGRPHTVKASTNRAFHRVIEEFARTTGVPMVLNTSFNENEPIVESPQQALDCFMRTDMDAVVLESVLVRRVRRDVSRSA
jgi:carbamoyltransferase